MIIKKTFFTLLVLILLSTNSYSAGTDSTAKVKSDYDKAVTIIKAAKKYEKKGKLDKANKRYEKAQASMFLGTFVVSCISPLECNMEKKPEAALYAAFNADGFAAPDI